MPIIENLFIEIKEVVERSLICHRNNEDLELCYLMGRLMGYAILIHQLTISENPEHN